MSNSYRKRKCKRSVRLMVVLGITAYGLLGTVTAPVSAGPNGQKINYYSRGAYKQCTTGINQDNNPFGFCAPLRPGSNPDEKYLWVGQVRINWYYPDDSYAPTACLVPKSQQDGDYVTCHDPI